MKGDSKKDYWGKFSDSSLPQVRYDPLQSYIADKQIFGYRVHVVLSRGDRPRDHKKVNKNPKGKSNPSDSILMRIADGKDLSIPVSGNQKIIGSPFDEPKIHNLNQFQGLTIVNKYAAVNGNASIDPGIALVSFSTSYSEHLDKIKPIEEIILSLRTTLNDLIPSNNENDSVFRTSIVFFNIGSTSGASLKQLHSQSYVLTRLHGSLSESFQRAFDQYTTLECVNCKLANSDEKVRDHLNQIIDINNLTIWEDENVRMVYPFAPIRPISIRIYLKDHCTWIGNLSDEQIVSIAKAFNFSYIALSSVLPRGWSRGLDRSIAFRQSMDYESDFHMVIDLLSTIPMGAAEIVDNLSISSFVPEDYAKKMRDIIESEQNN